MFTKKIININNLINNINIIKAKNPHTKLCAMVKARAYGVGQNIVVPTLNEYVDFFGVSSTKEGREIRPKTDKPIIVFGALDKTDFDIDLEYMCQSAEDARFFVGLDADIKVHIAINTGMNRYGITTTKEFVKVLTILKSSKVKIAGLYTHFATNDNFVATQTKRFMRFKTILDKCNIKVLVHTDNSEVFNSQPHNFDMVRIGFNLYNNNQNGYLPVVEIATQIVKTLTINKGEMVGYNRRFVAKQKTKVAVLPIGYADGFTLKLIGFRLIVGGKKLKIINVCMDCLMLDISKTKLKKGDTIKLLDSANPLNRYAKYLGITSYEVMCNFNLLRALVVTSVDKDKKQQPN